MSVEWVLAAVAAAAGMVAAVPWALRRTAEDANARAWQRYWLIVAAIGAGSLLLPRGGIGVGLALFYLAASGTLALSVPARLLRVRPWPLTEPAAVGALLAPLVGAVLLVIERISPEPRAELLGWVAAVHGVGFALSAVLARRAGMAGVAGADIRAAAAGCAVLAWAPTLTAIMALWAPWPAAGGLAVAGGAGLFLALRFRRPQAPEPCSAQTCSHHAVEHPGG